MRKSLPILFFALLGYFNSVGADIDSIGQLRLVANVLKELHSISYSYTITAVFPTSESDKISGEIFFDGDQKQFYNECDAFTLWYNGSWFMRADHRKKTVSIVNLGKEINRKTRSGIEKDFFMSGAINRFVDSIVLKKATIESVKTNGDTMRFSLVFPRGFVINKLILAFDTKAQLLTKYEMYLIQNQVNTGNAKSSKNVKTQIICSRFRKAESSDFPECAQFFAYKKGKYTLNKYKNYKLTGK